MSNILDKITVEPRQEATLIQQLKQQIIWLIASGQLKAGDCLPSVRRLAQHLKININTVSSAYQRLEADGLVKTRHGSGTRVLPFDPTRLTQTAGSQRSHTVGVILPNMANPFYHAFLQGVEQIASQDKTMLFVCNAHEDMLEALQYFAQLSAKQVDGIIIASMGISQFLTPGSSSLDEVPSALPFVTVDWPDSPGYVVLLDLENAGYQATRHLLEHGHRRVGLITFARDISNVRPVNAGYQRALQEADFEIDPDLIARVAGFDMAAGAEGTHKLLSLPQPPTAIFAIADTLALGVMNTIQTVGLRIPQDIALASFNDIVFAALVNPPLTTVAAPVREMGLEAMQMLQSLINGQQPTHQRILLPTSLVVRQSCGIHEQS